MGLRKVALLLPIFVAFLFAGNFSLAENSQGILPHESTATEGALCVEALTRKDRSLDKAAQITADLAQLEALIDALISITAADTNSGHQNTIYKRLLILKSNPHFAPKIRREFEYDDSLFSYIEAAARGLRKYLSLAADLESKIQIKLISPDRLTDQQRGYISYAIAFNTEIRRIPMGQNWKKLSSVEAIDAWNEKHLMPLETQLLMMEYARAVVAYYRLGSFFNPNPAAGRFRNIEIIRNILLGRPN